MKVLIIDDSSSLVARLTNLLYENKSVEITGYAGNYAEAVKALLASQSDLILLDIRIPGGSGIDLINMIKYCQPAAKIAMLTNYSVPQIRKRCKELGADYFFDKSKEIEKAIQLASGDKLNKNGFEGI